MDGKAAQSKNEYTVKLTKVTKKKFHVMRFKPPHKCNLEELVNPILDRQTVAKAEDEGLPETGEGSEYGRKRREEARRRRRGYRTRTLDPDDQPWILKERRKGGKHFVGRKEGTVSAGSSYFVFTIGQDGNFEVSPVDNWYDFVPPVKYNYLDADEAEERFEQRNKTLNYFSIMLSKKLKDSEEGGEDEYGASDSKEPRAKERKKTADTGLLLTDSDSGGFSSDESDEGSPEEEEHTKISQPAGKKDKAKVAQKKKKKGRRSSVEAGEDTDEGDMESREVDYMTDSSSGSEQEFQARQTQKDLPKDDEEIDRKEQVDIDKGFVESSSSEDELTDKGKELKELMKKMSGGGKESGAEDANEEEEGEMQGNPETAKSKPEHSSPGSSRASSNAESKSSKTDRKRTRKEESEEKMASSRSATPETSNSEAKPTASPPSKKHKVEFSPNTITEEEVKLYLQRRPMASKDLVRKFINKKTGMDRIKIVEMLHSIIEKLPNVERQLVKEKLYLSLKPEQ